ncbi:HAMP domain-containing sensor histidine kinase [Aurantimonas sp. 22II-16-19i]|uniref:ATP-binding protein n=1 Tax=Aurantimonas sp. 22II-16-19i TaxID=1317114 RepID=UPI0009F7E167|nr:HAMP domain-containing sensor histidine kinase [Aurantimonas sp. 22II-16-19i]ORE94964.1 integral membrane sensor signal transduction histidine kinase [Aurantimonas sp. 22II-16-19i]
MPKRRRRLSTRILVITAVAVMLAEVLIFVPSVSKFRYDWLTAKIETVAVAGLASEEIDAGPESVLGPNQESALLQSLDAQLIAINDNDASRLLARAETVGVPDVQINLSEQTMVAMILGAFDTLVFGGDRVMRVQGEVGAGPVRAEVVMAERPLHRAMLVYSRNVFLLSLSIALFAAVLVYTAISRYLVRPILGMTHAMIRFGANPTDPERIIVPSRRDDEIGVAEVELAAMQRRLTETLREQRHLADLGLAVSKINHDLRNILASSQMISDRLAAVEDPTVQRFAPLLLRSLDRALHYTQSVLAYGRAVEREPVRREVRLRLLVDDVYESLIVDPDWRIELVNAVPSDLLAMVDPDQFHRVILNLCRNAVEALAGIADDPSVVVRQLRVGGDLVEPGPGGWGGLLIFVEDTGPGMPEVARENLFKAFRGSARSGGTGLGLPIAAEIVEAHGGAIRLSTQDQPGTRFEISLPGRAARREPVAARA